MFPKTGQISIEELLVGPVAKPPLLRESGVGGVFPSN